MINKINIDPKYGGDTVVAEKVNEIIEHLNFGKDIDVPSKGSNMETTVETHDIKTEWETEFDNIGFGNQAMIVGTKRVDLKQFIRAVIIQQALASFQIFREERDRGETEILEKIMNILKLIKGRPKYRSGELRFKNSMRMARVKIHAINKDRIGIKKAIIKIFEEVK